MDILSYLTELVKTRREVGLPGLGTFYKKKSPGRYDADAHSFLPPSYILSFKTEVKEDKVLRDFVSKTAHVDLDNATYHIDQFADEIRGKLENGEEVKLDNLGTLKKVADEYLFIPENTSVFGFDSYGMPGILETNIQPEQAEVIHDEQPVYEEISELPTTEKVSPPMVIETAEVMAENDPEITELKVEHPPTEYSQPADKQTTPPVPEFTYEIEREQEERRGMPAYLIVIIVGAVIFAALIAAYYYKPELFGRSETNNEPIENSTVLPPIDTALADTTLTDTTASTNNNNPGDTVLTAAGNPDSAQTTTPPAPVDNLVFYEIIAASLLNQKEADGFLKQMERKGIPAKIADMPGKRIKISIGTFTDEAEANAQLKLLRKTTKIPGIYIYTNKHTNNNK